MKGKKKGRVEKHRGNPHGNSPNMRGTNTGKVQSDDQLRQEVNPGVSESQKNKQ